MHAMLRRASYDVAIIGGGVVGLGVARAVALDGLRCCVLEAGDALCASAASGGNTGIACTAPDAPVGTLERALLARAEVLNAAAYDAQRVPHATTGGVYRARTAAEAPALSALFDAHGPDRAVRLADGAVRVLGEIVVDPWLAPMAWAAAAEANGCDVATSAAVEAAAREGGGWTLRGDGWAVRSSVVVNCGGLWADEVERLGSGSAAFAVAPVRGDYHIYGPRADAPAAPLGGAPGARGRGPYCWTTVHGDVVVGPTAYAAGDARRLAGAPSAASAASLAACAARALPTLADAPVLATYGGLRPALADGDDYRIEAADEGWITVAGVRSTGLTASLAIGDFVRGLARRLLPPERAAAPPRLDPVLPRLPSLADLRDDYRRRGDGTVAIGGRARRVTHPQTVFGLGGTYVACGPGEDPP